MVKCGTSIPAPLPWSVVSAIVSDFDEATDKTVSQGHPSLNNKSARARQRSPFAAAVVVIREN